MSVASLCLRQSAGALSAAAQLKLMGELACSSQRVDSCQIPATSVLQKYSLPIRAFWALVLIPFLHMGKVYIYIFYRICI